MIDDNFHPKQYYWNEKQESNTKIISVQTFLLLKVTKINHEMCDVEEYIYWRLLSREYKVFHLKS